MIKQVLKFYHFFVHFSCPLIRIALSDGADFAFLPRQVDLFCALSFRLLVLLCHIDLPIFVSQNMGLPSVMVLPLLIVIAAGVYYIYNEVIHFMSKSLVRNKVVVITDAVSGVGTGK